MELHFLNTLPLITLAVGIVLCLIVDSILPRASGRIVQILTVTTLVLTLLVTAVQWREVGLQTEHGWFVFDLTSLFLCFLTLVTALFTLFNAESFFNFHAQSISEICVIVLFATFGAVTLFSSEHLLVNFLGLETMSLALTVLAGSQKKNFKSNEAALKSFIIQGTASAIFLFGIALFYAAFGTLQLNVMTSLVTPAELDYLPRLAVGLVLVCALTKLAVVPFHAWGTDVTDGTPTSFVGFSTATVAIALFGFVLRFFSTVPLTHAPQVQSLLTIIAVLTLIVSSLAILTQDDMKRILSYALMTHVGFILLAIASGLTTEGLSHQASQAVLFFLVSFAVLTMGAFAVLSLLTRENAEGTSVGDIQGLAKKHPVLCSVFTLFLLGLIGIPGTVGFAAKFNVISLAIENNHLILALIALLSSAISAAALLKPVMSMFFKDVLPLTVNVTLSLPTSMTITVCTFATVSLGVNPEALIQIVKIASAVLK